MAEKDKKLKVGTGAYQDPAMDLMMRAGEIPQYQQLMDYLMARRAVPSISTKYMRDELYGVFEHPGSAVTSTTPADHRGRITLNEGAPVATLVHEVTHAATKELQRQYSEGGTTWGEASNPNQFTDAMDKLLRYTPTDYKAGKNPPAQELAKRLDPAWLEANKDYRANTSEISAFALGNSTKGPLQDFFRRPPAHLEPTLATEFLILLDLATRAEKKKPPAGR